MWLWLALGAKRPEPVPQPPPPPPPPEPWSAPWLAAATAEIAPVIERQAGRSFVAPPVVELASAEDFNRIWKEEQALILGAILRDTPPELREAMIGDVGLVPGILGKYAIFDKKLVLCRDEIEAAAPVAGVDAPKLARVILTHELVHVLHAQHVDLAGQVRGAVDLDAFKAAMAVSEGLATWVGERVGAELGWQAEVAAMAKLQGWDDHGLLEPMAWPVYASYGLGRDAMAWHFAHGGLDEVWAVATTPPTLSSGVYHPETWAAPRPPPTRDWSAILLGAEQKLTEGPWSVGLSVLGEYDLLGEATLGGDPSAVREVLAHLVDARQLDLTRSDREGELRVLVFDEPAQAVRYLDLLQAQQATEASRMTALGAETEISFVPFDAKVAGDRSVLRSSRLAGAEGVSTERQSAWVVRGATLVVVSAGGFRAGNRLGWTVDELFARLAIPQ